jgi:hypothetical protein
MIGLYLPNNNEKSYSVVLQKILHLNQPQVNGFRLWKPVLFLYKLILRNLLDKILWSRDLSFYVL